MSAGRAPAELPALDELRLARDAGAGLRIAGFLAVPALLALACAGLWLHVRRQHLDALEQPHLTADAIRDSLVQHLVMTGLGAGAAVLVGVPLGMLAARALGRGGGRALITLGNVARAAPALGVLVLAALLVDERPRYEAAAALAAVAVLPVARVVAVGLRRVDRSLIEAARGVGMTRGEAWRRISLPLGLPAALAGVRVALGIAVAGAALAAYTGAGGLGELIRDGIRDERDVVILAGAVLLGVLALALDWFVRLAEALARPRGT
ncbi:MAG: osmoprotectant transport system permease protein [Miltoncostaeaceae bacterium]|nr:osmoprotectant transport system permease protein [Miltoncostaeaceae bacterium]